MIVFLVIWLILGFISWVLNSFLKINKIINLIKNEISLPDKVVQIKIKDLNKIQLNENPIKIIKECITTTISGPLAIIFLLKRNKNGL